MDGSEQIEQAHQVDAARPTWLLTWAMVVPQLVVGIIYAAPVALGRAHWWSDYRNYYLSDQLSYAAIAVNVKESGRFLVEPFTQTGHLYYPSAYYGLIGLLARIFGVSVPSVLTVVGIAAIMIPTACIGFAAWRFTSWPLAPLAAIFPLALGTLSGVAKGDWLTSLRSHAVLWGTYGGTFTLNGEVAGSGLCIVGASGLLVRIYSWKGPNRRALASIGVWAACIGASANVHAYPFLMGTAITLCCVAAYGLLSARTVWPTVATCAMIVVLFLAGPWFVDRTNNLAVYGVLVLAVSPGVVVVARSRLVPFIVGALGWTLGAAPQLALEAIGLARKDQFLSFRQAGSAGLGVEVGPGLRAALPLGLAMAFVLANAWHVRDRKQVALMVGGASAWVIMSANNVWGFDQEPYRMWLVGMIQVAFLTVPGLALASYELLARPDRNRLLQKALGVAASITYLVAFCDLLIFWSGARSSGVLDLQSARNVALADVVRSADGLMAYGPCVDPTILKVVSGKQVAYYNIGIAWPSNRTAIDQVVQAWARGEFSEAAMRSAGVRFVVIDDQCATKWNLTSAASAKLLKETKYIDSGVPGSFSLWRLEDDSSLEGGARVHDAGGPTQRRSAVSRLAGEEGRARLEWSPTALG